MAGRLNLKGAFYPEEDPGISRGYKNADHSDFTSLNLVRAVGIWNFCTDIDLDVEALIFY